MRLQPVPLVGGCYADDTKPYSAQDCVNWIPERAEVAGGRSDGMLRNAPGLALIFGSVTPSPGDALIEFFGGRYLVDELGRRLTA